MIKAKSQAVNRNHIAAAKGLAILAVILLHFLASLNRVYLRPDGAGFFVFIDQLARFCVPVFIAASAYGLTKKYLTTPFSWPSFIHRRLFKLLPLYLLWSALLIWSLSLEPFWYPPAYLLPIWQRILMGGADYQLYFVPLILQLYVLFPFLLKTLKKCSHATLFITGVIQIAFFGWYVYVREAGLVTNFFALDQGQYIFFGTWIFYFYLGMWLAYHDISKRLSVLIAVLLACVVSLAALYQVVMKDLSLGIDPIIALRFTKFSLIPYGTAAVLLLLGFPRWSNVLPAKIYQALATAGKYSYLLFLSHTIVLRILFSGYYGLVSIQSLLIASLLTVVGVVLSLTLFKE
ncbi:MAG: acyltransferase [bacterium]|nr:acyltransferase [bacterium]